VIRDRPWERALRLRLAACRVTDKALVELARALERERASSALRAIDVSDCQRLGRDAFAAIASIVELTPGFEALKFRGCGRIEDDAVPNPNACAAAPSPMARSPSSATRCARGRRYASSRSTGCAV